MGWVDSMESKRCVSCGDFKDILDFNWRYKNRGIRQKACRECQKSERRKWYENNRKQQILNVKRNRQINQIRSKSFIREYLETHPCSACGETDPQVLEFDHVGSKNNTISRLLSDGYSVAAIKKEIAQCQVLCANCHRRKTGMERGWWKS